MRIRYLFFALGLGMMLTNTLTAQTDRNWELGAALGISSYQGDIYPAQNFTFQDNRMAFGGYAKHYFNKYWSVRLSYYQGDLQGDDQRLDVRDERLASFETPIREIALRVDLDAMGEMEINDHGVVPYIFAGAGLTFFDPDTDYGLYENADFAQAWVAADQQNLEAQQVLSIPLGAGVKYNMYGGWTIGLELGYRLTFTDYLDGVSATGEPGNDDSYVIGTINFGKRFSLIGDSDGDGVPNNKDDCPNTVGLQSLNGCPDTDMDGVPDADDECPNTPGLIALNGCPDADGDGIPDIDDKCPHLPGLAEFDGCPDTDGDGTPDHLDDCPRQAGLKKYNGCADTDGDGIIDNEDDCPREAGLAINNGCPDRDRDGDGVVDRLDACPDQPGEARFDGCPDTDGDGVPDLKDKCPNSAGPASNDGCPEIKKEDKEELDLAVQNVNFESGKAVLLTSSYPTLDKIVELLKKYPDYALKINGYTDSRGDDATNLQLSKDRAATCVDYILEKGIAPFRITSEGFGEADPVATNETAAGREQNRRVEFELYIK